MLANIFKKTSSIEGKARQITAGLAIALGALFILTLGWGQVSISPAQLISILLEPLGGGFAVDVTSMQQAAVWQVRLPRALAAILIGLTLALGGAASQSLFRNPLADPGLLGVSGGASLGAVAFIVLSVRLIPAEWRIYNDWILPLFAFVGAAFAVGGVLKITSRPGERTSVLAILIAGVAMNALVNAGVGYLTFAANDAQARDITFWTLGSLAPMGWAKLAVLALFTAPCAIALLFLADKMNLLLLGEAEAAHLGLNVDHFRRQLIFLITFSVATCVAFTGVVAFVALVSPHLVRLVLGPNHKRMLLPAALTGALILLGADWLARLVVRPAELPIGVLTALLGAPFLFRLIKRANI